VLTTHTVSSTSSPRPVEDALLDALDSELFCRAWFRKVVARSPSDALILHQFLVLLQHHDMREIITILCRQHGRHRTHFYRVLARVRADAQSIKERQAYAEKKERLT
jgi:hypothetical protein